MRIEDTDRQRSTEEATQLIFESMNWLGLDYDRESVFQSQRLNSYRAKASELVEAGEAYYCTCTKERLNALREEAFAKNLKPRYDNKCRDLGLKPSAGTACTIRFRNPMDGTVEVDDMVQGRVVYQNTELDDLIIIRTDGTPTYNFAVVVDEIEMGCTHVIRGDDHLNNTPRQINLFHAFGESVPSFGHVPMILSPEGRKLSKRENEASVLDWRSEGYLPEAVLNYLVRLGWSHGDQELFSVEEMVENFDVRKIHRSPASLDNKKFQWINHQHMMKLPPTKAIKMAEPFFKERGIEVDDSERSQQIFEAQQSRSHTLIEFVEKSVYFFSDVKEYDEKAAAKHLTLKSRPLLAELRQSLANLPDWKSSAIHAKISEIVQEREIGFGAIAQPVRVALTGNTVSPGIDVTIELVGRDKVLQRLDSAMDWINKRSD